MKTGKVKKFYEDKGYGFIVPDEGNEGDVFVHRMVYGDGKDRSAYLTVGDAVEYEAEWDAERKKNMAKKCTGWKTGGLGFGGPVKDTCADFRKGMCDRGDSCKYSHGDGATTPASSYGAIPGIPDLSALTRASPYDSLAQLAGIPGLSLGGMPLAGMPGGLLQTQQLMPQLAPGGLPLGWEKAADPTTGKEYYANRLTGESSWTPPVDPNALALQQLQMQDPNALALQQLQMQQLQMQQLQQLQQFQMPSLVPGMDQLANAMPQLQAAPAALLPGADQLANAVPQLQTTTALLPGSEPASTTAPQLQMLGVDQLAAAYPAAATQPVAVEQPVAPPAQAPSTLPEGWEQTTDPATGKPYYFNRATGASSWTPPN